MELLVSLLEKIAMLGAGAASLFFCYEPKLPESLMK